jgi:hypothetical protein
VNAKVATATHAGSGIVAGCLAASGCCPPPMRALPPHEELTTSLDASTVRTYGATMSLATRAPDSEVPVLLAGESLAIHVELPPAAQDVFVTLALRGPDERAALWSSGVPREHEMRIATRRTHEDDRLELDVGVFVPTLEVSGGTYCATVELDVVRGDVMRRRGASGTRGTPGDADLQGMAPGDWTRVAMPVLVVMLETATHAIDDAEWKRLAAKSEQCAAAISPPG